MAKVFGGASYNAPTANEHLVQKQYADLFGGGGSVVSGIIVQFSGTTVPTGWLACDGSAVSRTTYSSLFSAIGTLHGVGDGSTTFNLPDHRRRVPIGKGTSDTVGQTDGLAEGSRSLTHTHSIPAHNHGMGSGADLNITASGSGTTGGSGTSISINATNTDHTHALAGSGNGAVGVGNHAHSVSDPQHVHEGYVTANSGGSGIRATYRFDSSLLTAFGIGYNTGAAFTGIGVNFDGSHSHSLSGNTGSMSANTSHGHTTNGATHTHSTPNHTHPTGNIAGRVGLVTGGVDGNAAMTSGSVNTVNYVMVHNIIKI